MIDEPLPALTVIQPWAGFLALGVKHFETRGWATSYRGRVAIHAGLKRVDPAEIAELLEVARIHAKAPPRELVTYGAVIAVARLAEVISAQDATVKHAPLGSVERTLGDFGLGRFAWHFTDVQLITPAVPARGAQGLFGLPPEVKAQVLAPRAMRRVT